MNILLISLILGFAILLSVNVGFDDVFGTLRDSKAIITTNQINEHMFIIIYTLLLIV